METSYLNNNFLEYITKLFTPSCIVYSTDESKKTMLKNNLTPAEFLRPFGNFIGYNVNFSYAEKFTINIKNFRLDFHDSEKFKPYDMSKFNESLELVLIYNAPDWDYKQLNLTNRAFIELFKKKLKNNSTSWFEEYERLICETLRFSVYEMYQQPLANIYMCSTSDEIELIDILKKKNIPNLISENVLESRLSSMILLLNDMNEKKISTEKLLAKVNLLRNKYPKSLVMCLDINTQNPKETESKLDDIWFPYLHKVDVYNSSFVNYERGQRISLNEREIFKTSIFNFFDDNIKSYLQKLANDLDDEISNNKKGFKNGFLGLFKKAEKAEYIMYEGNSIYKLTVLEKKIYLLTMLQFYFRDYDNCIENLKLLMNDIKTKSNEYFNSFSELLNIAKFLNGKKDIDFDSVYLSYKKINSKLSFRYLMIYMRMLETSKKFNEMTKIFVKYVNEIPINFVIPLLLEKVSICHLYSTPPNIRKFCLYQALSGMTFKNLKIDMKKYVLNNFGNVIKFFMKNSPSFSKIKEYVNLNIGEICLGSNKFDGGQIFFRNYLELYANKFLDQEQDYVINHYLKCIASARSLNMNKLVYVPLNYFSIPEIINNSLIIIHEQDQENCNAKCWRNFKHFSKVKERIWANLTENDMDVVMNLDNITEGKQNFVNMQSKRIFKSSTNSKIIVKFVIKNPLNVNLNISKLKLICDFIPKDANNEGQGELVKNQNINVEYNNINPFTEVQLKDEIIYDEKNLNLEKFEEKLIDLYCIPKVPGRLIIKGLEIGLFKMALFCHSFYEKVATELYKQKDNYVKAKPKDICYDITDEKQDISIKFSSKDYILYKNELSFIKIKIENNSNAKLKRYSVFLDDNEYSNLNNKTDKKFLKRHSKSFASASNENIILHNNLSSNSNEENLKHHIGNVSVFKFFHREIDILKNDSNEVKFFFIL